MIILIMVLVELKASISALKELPKTTAILLVGAFNSLADPLRHDIGEKSQNIFWVRGH